MLNKIFGKKKPNNHSLDLVHATVSCNPSGPGEKGSQALKIIHAGGHAERYYMAIPAARIIEKYPSFILARPEIFRRPWDSIVRPEDILVPGQKYYVVPRRTVKKLRSRIRKASVPGYPGLSSFESKSLVCNGNSHKDGRSISGILVKPGRKVKAQIRHVSFFGIEKVNRKYGPGSEFVSSDKKSGNKKEKVLKEKKRRNQNECSWEPPLGSINE